MAFRSSYLKLKMGGAGGRDYPWCQGEGSAKFACLKTFSRCQRRLYG